MGELGKIAPLSSERIRTLRNRLEADLRLADDYAMTGHPEYAAACRRMADEIRMELMIAEQEAGMS